jgi:hypothetical protein
VRALGGESKTHSAIFRTTPQQLAGPAKARPIAFDDSSKDFLDTRDLRRALSEAQAVTGRRLDLIGMDACLMAMIEGARELAPYADYFVASQEVEPMAGWPYTAIVTALDKQRGLPPADLATTIVTEFAKSLGGQTRVEETVTQSAIALARTAGAETLVKALVDAILARKSPALRRLMRERTLGPKQTLVFEDRNYRDLGDFAARLAAETEFDYPQVHAAAKALAALLNQRGGDGPVLRVGFRPAYQRATGLSVYLPSFLPAANRAAALKIYRPLLFPQSTGWDRFLDWLFDEF